MPEEAMRRTDRDAQVEGYIEEQIEGQMTRTV